MKFRDLLERNYTGYWVIGLKGSKKEGKVLLGPWDTRKETEDVQDNLNSKGDIVYGTAVNLTSDGEIYSKSTIKLKKEK